MNRIGLKQTGIDWLEVAWKSLTGAEYLALQWFGLVSTGLGGIGVGFARIGDSQTPSFHLSAPSKKGP